MSWPSMNDFQFGPKNPYLLEELKKKSDNAIIKSKAMYEETIKTMKDAAKKINKHRLGTERDLLRMYGILEVAGESRIIRKKNAKEQKPKTYVYFEEIYD